MSKYERLSRLMQVMNLIRSHRNCNRELLADELEVSVRTVQRDINSLCYAGIPVFWSGTRYEIMDGYFMPPTNLSLDEVLELICAVRNHAEECEGSQRKAIESAMTKIIARLPDKTLGYVKAIMNEVSLKGESSP